MRSSLSAVAALVTVLLVAAPAVASTGVCDQSPATIQACIDAVQNAGTVVNDVFKDSNGLLGDQLPIYGQLFNNWPACPDVTDFAGCSGVSTAPYNCPGGYTCTGQPNNYATATQFLAKPDHTWWHPCRLANAALNNGCPQWGCIADGVGGNYYPWEGLVFDLGGPSNKVVIFAQNDHGPQPCESLEYTIYLTDNPYAQDVILDPKANGVDPMKWNRAVLTKIYTWGWFNTRVSDPVAYAACGDTANYAVEDDSFTQVFALPCGITFRYASVVAGNDGLDFPACAYDSQEAELDAVAGLTESGSAVCPDADNDHYVDCNCPGAPPVCDCNDGDPSVHPGAPEKCDDTDKNCDGKPGACDAGLSCYQSICIPSCGTGENPFCPPGSSCADTPQGKLCVPVDCSVGGCPAGSTCKGKTCVPLCDMVTCPGAQICQDGACIDPCTNVICPQGESCQGGLCKPPCNCFAGDVGCLGQPNTVCDSGGSNICVAPLCKGVNCPSPSTCDPMTGACVAFCNMNVTCPLGQKCVEPAGCVPVCDNVMCPMGLTCNQTSGVCEDHRCDNVTCIAPSVCVAGACETPDGGAPDGGEGGAGGGGDAGPNGTGGAGGAGGVGDGNRIEVTGCGCETVGGGVGSLEALGALSLALALARRRRRSS